ncbi:PDZ domain family protein, partial [Acinetobacter baumannii 1032359]
TGNQASASKGPVLGMSIRDLAVPEKNALGIKGGIYVQDVRRGGLASLSNIIPGDVIIQVNNTQILNSQDFAKVVSNLPKNTVARVGIIRQGQRAMLGLRIQ